MTRSCQEFRLQISALTDDSLELALGPTLETHLSDCASCTHFYREQLDISNWLSAHVLVVDPTPEIWTKIESSIRVSKRPWWQFLGSDLVVGTSPFGLRYALSSLAFLLILSGAFLVNKQGTQSDHQVLLQLSSYSVQPSKNPFLLALEKMSFPPSLTRGDSVANPFALIRGNQ